VLVTPSLQASPHLVVEAGPGLSDGRRVGQHTHGTLDLGEVTAGDDGRGLVVDTDLEAGGAPVWVERGRVERE